MRKFLHFQKICKIQRMCMGSKSKNDFPFQLERYLQLSKKRYNELSNRLSDPTLQDSEMRRIGKEIASLSRLVSLSDEKSQIETLIKDLNKLEKDEFAKEGSMDHDMIQLISSEKESYLQKYKECELLIMNQLVPKDDDDNKGAVIEVRTGTGGDEASLFASELFKMYQKFCELKGWKWEQLSITKSDIGGFKEAQALIKGEGVLGLMKFESGVHRVQRIPVNDTKIQTSAASVIILPEADEVDIELRREDLKIDVFRSQGAGGQSVNKTESAVRITHLPTGLVVSMQDERSQIQNRARAMLYLRARVYDYEKKKSESQRSELRSLAGGTGDRSDKIRTYNFPQDRTTDHRIGMTVSGIDRLLSGLTLGNILESLVEEDEKHKLAIFLQTLQTS